MMQDIEHDDIVEACIVEGQAVRIANRVQPRGHHDIGRYNVRCK